ncbi:MAG: hypothetical protein ABIZ81_08175 [Opitutaceae bacterium]
MPFSETPFPATTLTPFPKTIHIPALGELKTNTAPAEKPEQRPAFKLGVTVTLVVAGLVLCAGGVFGWKQFSTRKSPGRDTPTATGARPGLPASNGNSPSTLSSASGATGLQTSVATPPAANPASVKGDDGAINLDLDRPARINPPASGELPANSSLPIATTVTANTGVPVAIISASPEFLAFVATVKISGVFQGTNSRAFMNGRLTRLGESIDTKLGVLFEGIDAEKKLIIFKDASGAIATRKY